MALRNSTQLGVGSIDDRWSAGFLKSAASGLTAGFATTPWFGGLVMAQDALVTGGDTSGRTLMVSTGATTSTQPIPVGLLVENQYGFSTVAAQGDHAAGGTFDTIFYARGGVFSVMHRPGNVFDIFDDNSNTTQVTQTKNGGGTVTQNQSAPFITTDTFAVGSVVYCSGDGLLTVTTPGATAGTNIVVGVVRAVTGTGITQRITLELGIRLV